MEASHKSDGTVAPSKIFVPTQHGQAVATDRVVSVAGRGQGRGGAVLITEWFSVIARSLKTFR